MERIRSAREALMIREATDKGAMLKLLLRLEWIHHDGDGRPFVQCHICGRTYSDEEVQPWTREPAPAQERKHKDGCQMGLLAEWFNP